jgi:dephospho-CoA kinase
LQTEKLRRIVLIVGYIGSGKSEACKLLANEFGYTLVPCSKIMQEEIGCPPIDVLGRKGLQEIGYQFINTPEGHRRLAKATYKFMKKSGSKSFVLDGLRYPKTLDILEKMLKTQIAVIYVESTIDSLYKYFIARENSKNIANGKKEHDFSEFLEIVYHPVEREIERFYPLADVIVYNHGTKDDYLVELRKLFKTRLGPHNDK